MKPQRAQNPYSNLEHNGWFHNNHLVYNHHDHDECILTFEGSSHNEGSASGFDQLSNRALYLHPQGGSPIGLTLRKSDSLINLVEMTLSHEREKKKVESPEKLKASNFPALVLQIGTWRRISRNEGDLVAKIYYAKKKLVWEFLDGPLKKKVEIQWSEISAIKSFIYEGENGRLEIELSQPPVFCREINPQPRKHTQWAQTTDFTGGQASICRRHSVIFPPGALDKQYEKLLQCDKRLFKLSQQPFPVNNYPFFYRDPNICSDNSYMNIHQLPYTQFHGDVDSNSLMSELQREMLDGEARRYTNHFEGIHAYPIGVQDQQTQREMLHEEFNFTGYPNDRFSSVSALHVNSRSDIQERNSWIGVPHPYELPWESGMEEFGDLYRNHQYNPN